LFTLTEYKYNYFILYITTRNINVTISFFFLVSSISIIFVYASRHYLNSQLLNPDWPDGSTRLIHWLNRFRFVKRLAGATTRQNLVNLAGQPMTQATHMRPFFFKCGFSPIPFFFHIFKVHCINIRKIFYFFNVEFETLLVYRHYISKKKIIFSMWDLNPFRIYTLCSQEKSYIFSMCDKKILKYFFKLHYL